ncbi:hypothetical protein BJ166DRAFT_39997 [Pestalotiopsis sp. NC0098]|nr:hypothetical protein BJ166DRAFT_39997 [Pestalotiopsis sp. NC0098]
MPAVVTVAYPRPEGAVKFDIKYYIDKHMPLVGKTWGPKGLKSWTVTEHAEGPYVVQAILHWESTEKFGTAAEGDGGPEIFADVANFTDIQPIVLKGEVAGTWSA